MLAFALQDQHSTTRHRVEIRPAAHGGNLASIKPSANLGVVGELFGVKNAVPEEGQYHQVAVFMSAVLGTGSLVMADTLFWQDGWWSAQSGGDQDCSSVSTTAPGPTLEELRPCNLSIDANFEGRSNRSQSHQRPPLRSTQRMPGVLMLRIGFGAAAGVVPALRLTEFHRSGSGWNHLGAQIARLAWILVPDPRILGGAAAHPDF
jgi:hypothetical protein